MTNEEAIEVLKDIYNYTRFDTYTTNEARTMAIKALEQQTCEDAISRKDMLAVFSQSNSLVQAWDGFEKLPSVTLKGKKSWIPISEKLLEECSGVLVYCPENKNVFLAYLKQGKWYIFSPNGNEPLNESIVAWMPLPKPYKAESEDTE